MTRLLFFHFQFRKNTLAKLRAGVALVAPLVHATMATLGCTLSTKIGQARK